MKKNILDKKELAMFCEKKRNEGKTIVTCNGSFDLFHFGHLTFLEEAKEQGDVLIVGLNSDSSIKEYKSKDRPIISEDARSQIIAALEIVDSVYIFDEINPVDFVEIVKPDVHVNGAEYSSECIEAEPVKRNGGKVYLVKRRDGFSTTELIAKIKEKM